MVDVLKLDHRPKRDERITTHCILLSRIFGVKRFFYTGIRDAGLEKRIEAMQDKWGKGIDVKWIKGWKDIFKKHNIVHLTMYGIPFQRKIGEIKKCKDLLIVVGGPKVPSEIYRHARWNIAVSNQPHSEIAALAIFLWELKGRKFARLHGKIRIKPSARGKSIQEVQRERLSAHQ
ncbi:MAG: tRNA (cytidine(56)-2'-O)-methyltransferase [Candidatus Aenigmatarchaeota archaeon]